jgi:hypothetical protein
VDSSVDEQIHNDSLSICISSSSTTVTMDEIQAVISQQKKIKAAGPNGLQADNFYVAMSVCMLI